MDILLLAIISLSFAPILFLMINDFHPSNITVMHLTIFNLIYPVVCFYFVKRILDNDNQKKMILKQDKYIEEMRKQRHDFSNHLQTIYSLMTIGETDKAIKYINNFTMSVENTTNLSTIHNTELSSFLNSKTYEAINKQIDFKLNTYGTNLNDIKTSSYNLIKILSNLLDNAFQHASTQDYKYVVLDIMKKDQLYVFTVTNSGSIKETYKEIFNKGFTTKESGRGLGLTIVQEILEVCNGKIEIIDTEPVCFQVILP